MPEFTEDQHANEVHDELFESIQRMKKPAKAKLLKKMAKALHVLATNAPSQRVEMNEQTNGEQFQRVTTSPAVTTSTNPTNPRTLANKPRTHQRTTRSNTPGALPTIINEHNPVEPPRRRSPRLNEDDEAPIITTSPPIEPNNKRIPLYSPNIISPDALQHVIAQATCPVNQQVWTPDDLVVSSPSSLVCALDADIEHFCAGVVHPETGETITSYKKLIADPITYDVWSRAFGKEFGNLCQGDNLTGEKGSNSLFVMSAEDNSSRLQTTEGRSQSCENYSGGKLN
jgi:hypothetical protein